MTDVRYSWVVRNTDNEPWRLLPYRFTDRREALQTTEHWLHHYEQVRTVEVDEDRQWTEIS